MTQTYPAVLPSTLKVTDGTALTNPSPFYPTAGSLTSVSDSSGVAFAYEPDTYLEKAGSAGVAVGSPTRTVATIIATACNMPYNT